MGAERAPIRRPLDRVAARVSEAASPVLVKEVRQSLRSTFFVVVFSLALLLTTITGVGMLAFQGVIADEAGAAFIGPSFFSATLASSAFCAVAIVPFAAFASMNAESDQNALELLQLSNLRPVSIVLGKLLATALLASLVISVELPFAFLAWTMGGVDPFEMLLVLALVVAFSICLSAVAIAISSTTRTRWVRIVLMVLFGFLALTIGQNAVGMLFLGLFGGMVFGGGSLGVAAVGACALALALDATATAVAFACDQLAHREESHSTPLRYVAAVSAVVGAIVAAAWKVVRPHDDEALLVLGLALAFTALPLWLCCTEEERLPLGPRARPPGRGIAGTVRALFVSGGGRGAALATVLVGFLGATFVAGCLLRPTVALLDDVRQALVLCAYAWIYLLLPSGAMSFLTASPGGRVASRALTAVFPLAAFLGLTLLHVVLLGTAGGPLEHLANPFHALQRVEHAVGDAGGLVLGLAGVALLTLLVNVPRLVRAFDELARARRERDARVAVASAARGTS